MKLVKTRFEELGVNIPFELPGQSTVLVKIDDSRYIEIGKSGAHSIKDRKTYIFFV